MKELSNINLTSEPEIVDRVSVVHRANSIFHFMGDIQYLKKALNYQTLFPRYFEERIEYLGLRDSNGSFYEKIAVLGICFCDIHLSKILMKERIKGYDESNNEWSPIGLNHIEIYGKYGIAFSKEFAEEKGVSPVQYVNKKAKSNLKETFKKAMEYKKYHIIQDHILEELCYLKPLSGIMEKYIRYERKDYSKIEKSFYDESEWRYVPTRELCKNISKSRFTIQPLIANSFLDNTKQYDFLTDYSNALEKEGLKQLGIQFEYDDIKYLIVPNKKERLELISWFEQELELKRTNLYDLISKIVVLEDIESDY